MATNYRPELPKGSLIGLGLECEGEVEGVYYSTRLKFKLSLKILYFQEGGGEGEPSSFVVKFCTWSLCSSRELRRCTSVTQATYNWEPHIYLGNGHSDTVCAQLSKQKTYRRQHKRISCEIKIIIPHYFSGSIPFIPVHYLFPSDNHITRILLVTLHTK